MFRPTRDHHEFPVVMFAVGGILFTALFIPDIEFVLNYIVGTLIGMGAILVVRYYWNEHKKMQHVLTAPVEQLRQEERDGI